MPVARRRGPLPPGRRSPRDIAVVSSQRARSSSHVLRDVVAIGVARRFVSIDRMAMVSDKSHLDPRIFRLHDLVRKVCNFSGPCFLYSVAWPYPKSLQLFGAML